MYIVEKIGSLILITIEDNLDQSEIDIIKNKLGDLSSVVKEDVVVSFYHQDENDDKMKDIESKTNDLLKYCSDLGLRVYSYRS